jgi:hypothetical protein
MAHLETKIRKYLKNNGINLFPFNDDNSPLERIDFSQDIKITDNGNGAFISTWNLDITKPTDAQLNALEAEANAYENQREVIENRKAEYGTIEKQIEFITENGLDAWQDKVAEIKAKYPKA